jgi:DNA polymerase/3'-5' exonuclease PolX
MFINNMTFLEGANVKALSTRRRDSQLFHPQSEKEVFDIIGLPWVDPTLRNTDA